MTSPTQQQLGEPIPATPSTAMSVRLRGLSRELKRITRANRVSPGSLHDLRIACRRAEAALRLCREALESKSWCWLRRQIRSLRRLGNAARDDDVLRSWLKQKFPSVAEQFQREFKASRHAAARLIRDQGRWLLKGGRFRRRVAEIVRQMSDTECSSQMSVVFGRGIFDEIHRFVRSLPRARNDLQPLHQLRVIGKRLRYGIEIVSEIWPDTNLVNLHEFLQSLQKQVGMIHDLQVGLSRLKELASNKSPCNLDDVSQSMNDSRAAASQSFWTWWYSSPLERTLADATAELLRLVRSGL